MIAPATALAVPDCKRRPVANTLLSGVDSLESAIVDKSGRLFFAGTGKLYRLDSPGDEPIVLADGLNAPGGLAFGADGYLYLGIGDSIAGGAQGDIDPKAALLRVDPETGESTPFAEGLSMANGVVRGPGGVFYASNDIVGGIDRIALDGTVEHRWADVSSANGLVIDRARQFLFSAQTFQPAAIARVSLADPAQVSTYYSAPPGDAAAGLDGMVRDRRDRLYVAANGAGEVWRVNRTPAACSLSGAFDPFPDGPSALAFGHGKRGFSRQNLYVVSFAGEVVELAGARGPRRRPKG